MSSWFGGGKKDHNHGENLDDLPQYDTFNDLAPEFQLGPEHDDDHIFEREYELVAQVREKLPEVKDWPVRYILIFLFARRHSVPHTVRLLQRHLNWVNHLGFEPISESKGRMYPFKPEELEEVEREYALFGGHTLYKHNLVDNHDRLLQYKIMRFWFPGSHKLRDYIATSVLWWYYYSWQFVPLKYHRNGHAVVVDMKGMGWNNIQFTSEMKDFLTNATAGLPGRMRTCWIVNSNWMLSSAWAVIKYLLSSKILSRIHVVHAETLVNEIPLDNLPTDLGGNWHPDLKKEWYNKVVEMDKQWEESHGFAPKTTKNENNEEEKEEEKEKPEENNEEDEDS